VTTPGNSPELGPGDSGHDTFDLRYVAVEYELWGLGQVLQVLEATIDRLAQEDEAATIAALREAGATIDDGDVDIAYQDIAEKRNYVLPRFVRGPFVIALWATFESLIQAIARERAKATNAPLVMSQLRGDVIARATLYFDAILRLRLDNDPSRLNRLRDLYQVRNALVHANGNKEAMSKQGWHDLATTLLRNGVSVDGYRGLVVLPPEFVGRAFVDVSSSLRDLVARARE
jgi:hypothetical protein